MRTLNIMFTIVILILLIAAALFCGDFYLQTSPFKLGLHHPWGAVAFLAFMIAIFAFKYNEYQRGIDKGILTTLDFFDKHGIIIKSSEKDKKYDIEVDLARFKIKNKRQIDDSNKKIINSSEKIKQQ